MSALQLVRERLEGCGCNPRGSDRIEARCPAHDDRSPSLSVSVGDDGRVLLHCHAGCSIDDIVTALDLDISDLFTENGSAREIVATYDYVDEDGKLLYQTVRYVPKDFRQRRPEGNGGWIWNLKDTRRVLLRLPQVLEAVKAGKRIWIPEGEKDVEAVEKNGAVATTNPMGAGKWRKEYSTTLKGADVVVIADSDEPGLRHAREVVKSLQGVAEKVVIVGIPHGRKDVSEHLAAGGKLGELVPLEVPTRTESELSDLTLEQILTKAGISEEDIGEVDSIKDLAKLLKGGKNVASEIVDAVKEADVVLFHDDSQRGFVSFERDGHRETWPIRSRSFKLLARRAYYEATEKTPSGSAVDDAVAQLESEAIFAGEELTVFMRIAEADGCLFVDLGDEAWRCVQITRDGWTVLDQHPVRFIRTGAMRAMPEPIQGGSIDLLRAFLNVDDDGWRLAVGFLVACFRPERPFPVLQLHGEQGATKSTAARVFRKLVDPNKSPLRKAPKSDDDLMVSASKSWVMTFENTSHLERSLSDAICRLSTGGGLSKRALFTDDDEVVLDATRPVIITSIEEVATEPDLLDRVVLIELRRLDDAHRVSERSFWEGFDRAYPTILGALFDVVAGALKRIDEVSLTTLPRMADFAEWATAAELALGWETGSFMAAYTKNRNQSNEVAIEASAIGSLLCEIADQGFRGSMTELLDLLNENADEKVTKSRSWPKTARAVSAQLTRLAPNLRKTGYVVERHGRAPGGGRPIVELKRRAT